MDKRPTPCVEMDRMVSIEEDGISVVEVPIRRATPETFVGFGKIVSSFAEAEVEIVTWPAPGLATRRAGNRQRGRNHQWWNSKFTELATLCTLGIMPSMAIM